MMKLYGGAGGAPPGAGGFPPGGFPGGAPGGAPADDNAGYVFIFKHKLLLILLFSIEIDLTI